MGTRILSLAVAVATAATVSACGLMASKPGEASPQSGRITVDGQSHDTTSVTCTQIQWQMMIEADTAQDGQARAFLRLGDPEPVVRTVNIDNIDGRHSVMGGEVGDAKATTEGGKFTITGTAVGTDWTKPGQSKEMPFTIEVPC